MRRYALLIACVLPTLIVAEETPKDPCGGFSATASGEGRLKLEPDQATIEFGVVTQGASAADAGTKNAELVTAMMKALDRFKLESRTTTGYALNPNYVYQEGKAPKITSYTAMNGVRVKTYEIKDAGRLIDAAMTAGANTVNSLEFGVRNMTKARYDALEKATADAKARIDAMARGAGKTVVRIATIVEGGADFPMPINRNAMMSVAAEKMATATPIEAGPLEVTATVTMVACLAVN